MGPCNNPQVTTSEQFVRPRHGAIVLSLAGAIGVLSSFAGTVITFVGIESVSSPTLVGADNELGYPASAFAMALFVVVLSAGAAQLAGASFGQGWWTALVVLFSVGVVFEVWVAYLSWVAGVAFNWLLLLQLLLMVAALVIASRSIRRDGRAFELGLFLTVAPIVGFFAAFRLTVDKVGTFTHPDIAPSCDASVLVQCGRNLASWQGSLFGFPNPLLGVGGWIAVFVIGAMILAGLSFRRWFWIALNVGVAGALALVIWLIYQSIFIIGTLCPWCMVTWAVTIPTFWMVTLYNLKVGNLPVPRAARRFFTAAYGWVILVAFVSYVIVAVAAQLQLDVLHKL